MQAPYNIYLYSNPGLQKDEVMKIKKEHLCNIKNKEINNN